MKSLSILVVVAGFLCLADYSVAATYSTAYYNALADVVLSSVKDNAMGFYVDPYKMDNVTDKYRVGLITYKLSILNGVVKGAENMTRSGDVTVFTNSATNITDITFTLYFSHLTFDVDFLGKGLLVKASGDAYGEITDLTTTIVMQTNYTNSSAVTASILQLSVDKIGKIKATIKSTNLISTAIMNVMSKLILRFFKSYVVDLMETNMVAVLTSALSTMTFDFS